MFSIYDGRDFFWQWDSGQRIIVSDDVCCEVHFCNGTSDCALVCKVYTEDGNRLVNVPNILLQASKPIRIFAYAETDGDHRTLHCVTFAVLARTKPADYVYTETEVLSYQALEERVTALEENGGGSPSGTLHLFHKPNGINDYATEIEVCAGKPTDLNDDGRDPQSGVVEFFETHHDGPVILRNLKDGEYDIDAATVGQVKKAVEGLEITKNRTTTIDKNSTDEQYPSAKAVYTFVDSMKPFYVHVDVDISKISKDMRPVIGQSNHTYWDIKAAYDAGQIVFCKADSVMMPLTDITDTVASFLGTKEGYDFVVGFYADTTGGVPIIPTYGYLSQGDLPTTVSSFTNDAGYITNAELADTVGNIEIALDSIIAIQEELIGGDGQ